MNLLFPTEKKKSSQILNTGKKESTWRREGLLCWTLPEDRKSLADLPASNNSWLETLRHIRVDCQIQRPAALDWLVFMANGRQKATIAHCALMTGFYTGPQERTTCENTLARTHPTGYPILNSSCYNSPASALDIWNVSHTSTQMYSSL